MKTAEKVIIAAVCAAVAASGTFGGYKYNQIRKKNKAIVKQYVKQLLGR